MTIIISLILLAALTLSVFETRLTRKVLAFMSISIDALNAELVRLEAAAAAANAKLQAPPAAPDPDPAIDAATARVKAVADSLEAATPKV